MATIIGNPLYTLKLRQSCKLCQESRERLRQLGCSALQFEQGNQLEHVKTEAWAADVFGRPRENYGG